ncbi:EAL domain-containing protein [Pseudomonadota bacterium]
MVFSNTWQATGYELPKKQQQQGSAKDNSRGNVKLLVVDDEPRLCQCVKELLELQGYQCEAANGGAAAIQALQKSVYDVILLDLKMPEVDGHEVMQFVKKHSPQSDVIIVSGETNFEEATWALQQGAHDFLRKPYANAELLHSLESALHKRYLKAENSRMQKWLANSERRYRFLVNNSPDIIYMLDEKGRFSFINNRISNLLGYSNDDLLGKHYSEVVHPYDLGKAHSTFNECRMEPKSTRNIEFRMVKKGAQSLPDMPLESQLITVELNAMGVYEESDNADGKQFVGTYGVIRDISKRKKAEAIINHQLYHDALTSLPNRILFRDRLEIAMSHAKRNKKMLAVMFLDLDGFKIINDSLGHMTGDELLHAVAQRLRLSLRDGDTLARVGGDEFNLLLPEISCREDAAIIACKIISNLKRSFEIDGNEVFIGLSIGIALYPDDGEQIDILIRNADMAMYHIKGRGKNGYEFFSDNMLGRVSRHNSLENGLHKALEENQFVLMFQPQQAIDTGKIVGVESLIRWQHPEEGLISPIDFISLAEETGQITDIGEWVLRTACAEYSRWCSQGISDIKIAVNLSAAQLYRADFVQTVLDILEENQMPGKMLELEITENALVQDIDHVVEKLRQLAEHGIQVAVDDFGTGYSSLCYLQSLPLNTLKMDRSFINTIQSTEDQHSIITAIVSMAKDMELSVIAEGVETETQLEYLRSIGCPQAQGYLLSYPLSADHTLELLSTAH